jgi:hypothetical protein
MVREKILVVRGEIWTLLASFMFIILFHYILSRLCVTDTGSLTNFRLITLHQIHVPRMTTIALTTLFIVVFV